MGLLRIAIGVNSIMFRRQWIWFGKTISNEGFSIGYGHRSIIYSDDRHKLCFGFEDGYLFPAASDVSGKPAVLTPLEKEKIIDRVVSAIKWNGNAVKVFPN